MRKFLSLALLAAATASAAGCCSMCGFGGLGGCGRRNNACEPCAAPMAAPMDACAPACDSCGQPGGAVITTPAPVVTPGPATYSSSYLPR